MNEEFESKLDLLYKKFELGKIMLGEMNTRVYEFVNNPREYCLEGNRVSLLEPNHKNDPVYLKLERIYSKIDLGDSLGLKSITRNNLGALMSRSMGEKDYTHIEKTSDEDLILEWKNNYNMSGCGC